MRLAVTTLSPAPAGRDLRLETLIDGVSWAQLGDQLLLIAGASRWDEVSALAGRTGTALREHPREVRRKDLQLVVQTGRSFQQEHPDIPVIVDKGRYLVVELDPERAGTIGASPDACYGIRALKDDEVVFEERPARAAAARAPQAWIQSLVAGITRASYEAKLTHLASFPTRHSTSADFVTAATWARDELATLGYSTRLDTIAVGSGTSRNVVADKAGSGSAPRKLVIVTAHLDSVNTAGGAAAAAPGADDNASGSAGVIEIAKALRNQGTVHDLRFVLFGGEEQGLVGSNAYVAGLTAAERTRIDAVVNMDMVGVRNTPARSVLLEGATVSQSVIDDLAVAAADYTTLSVQTSLSPFASDHVPFINAALPAVLTIEGADGANSAIHTAADTIDRIDYDLALDILRMNTAFVATRAGQAGGTMPTIDWDDIHIDLSKLEDLFVHLRFFYSGRYTYGGGVTAREGDEDTMSDVTRNNPLYARDQPIFIPNPDGPDIPIPPIPSLEEKPSLELTDPLLDFFRRLRFTLHIDIDGPDALGVVSGAVRRGAFEFGTTPRFIGRVTSNTATSTGRSLVVTDFSYTWPGGTSTIDRLEIQLTGSFFMTPIATVTFMDTASGRSFGPYSAERQSRYFRDVEVDVDIEDAAVNVASYGTHSHPDRPAGLGAETLTLESAFRKAGVNMTRSPGSGTIVQTTGPNGAGTNLRWSELELHDSMAAHWDAFANSPQWKMWIFMAELGASDDLGGIMFDGEIDEPGGVDRQGTALFTRCPWFHTEAGGYITANPPTGPAVQRELFFNLIHETGHAFNLYHSHHKPLDSPWTPPAWMPIVPNQNSWMSYPELQSGTSANATAFYSAFQWKFDTGELLFLRHAPDRFVRMGANAWGDQHGRVTRASLDRRLQMTLSTRKGAVELGESMFVDLQLRNISNEPVTVHGNLDPRESFVEMAVTAPGGERKPFLAIAHNRAMVRPFALRPGDSIFQSVNLTMGKLGFAFKEPGMHRIEASYTNLDGRTAAAICQVYVNPPAGAEEARIVGELFNARVGRALYVGGTKVMTDVNEKLDWAVNRLGYDHPVALHLVTTRYAPMIEATKVVAPDATQVRWIEGDPERAVRELQPVIERAERAVDSLGPIQYQRVVDAYADAAVKINERDIARVAEEQLLGLLEERKVSPAIRSTTEERVKTLR